MRPEHPLATLERWRDHGAEYRVAHLSDALAIVDLCTCSGEPVERLESTDPRVIEYLRAEVSQETGQTPA